MTIHKKRKIKPFIPSQTMSAFKKEFANQAGGQTVINQVSLSAHIKISVRLPRGIVTSLTIKKNIIALWFLYRSPLKTDPEQIIDLIELDQLIKEDTVLAMVTDFVYKCMSKWDKDTGKGLSDFVTELMIEDALESEDHVLYTQLMRLI